MNKTPQIQEIERLFHVVAALRDPKHGCPWDLEQTHETLLRFLIEESYEFIDAVQRKNTSDMEEELGDVLLQTFLHSRLAEERGDFDIFSVAKKLADKLINRHPHVFDNDNKEVFSIEKIKENWEKSKLREGKKSKHHITHKDNLFPSLLSAFKIGKKTAQVNFDWENPIQVQYKVEEEWQELKEELAHPQPNKERVEEELGDLLFSCAQLARHLNLNPEEVLHKANAKFIKRFNCLEDNVEKDGYETLKELNHKQLEAYWTQSKNET